MIDYYLVYKFIKALTTPFSEWDAFKAGVIDKDGVILKSRKTLVSQQEKDSFTLYDLLMLNIKKILHKIPGGSTKLGSYAAALYLIKEHNLFADSSILLESELFIDDNQIIPYIESVVHREMNEDITNTVGGGNVSGLGGSNGEPGVSKSRVIKRFKTYVTEQDAIPTLPITYDKKQRRNKKHPIEAIPLA